MALVGHISGSSQSNSIIGISGSVIVANRANNKFPSLPGTDTVFFVSGASDDTATAVFGGKLFISGGVKSYTNVDVGGNLIVAGDLTVNGTTSTINTTNLVVKDAIIGLGYDASGATRTNGDRGWIGGLNILGDDEHVAMLWDSSRSEFTVGKVFINSIGEGFPADASILSYETFHASLLTGSHVKAASMTGSLTKLVDGTDYLRAGSNIQLTTGSAGQVTIGVTGLSSVPQYFNSTTLNAIYATGSVAFRGGETSVDAPSDKGSDVWFYVSGSTDGSAIALFGGGIVTSGSLSVFGNTTLGNTTSDLITFNARAGTDFLPANDNQYNLGSATNRWANVYTGDLHLKNDRGDWTVIEEDQYLSLRNNKTGKLYKLVMEPVGE